MTCRAGPGRPKLGVIAREVTLLPRHWDWLNSQPGGASVALRKLVEEARRVNEGRDQRFPLNLSCERKTICNMLFGNWLWQQTRSSYCTLSMLLVL